LCFLPLQLHNNQAVNQIAHVDMDAFCSFVVTLSAAKGLR
jgi:hypothetical protein